MLELEEEEEKKERSKRLIRGFESSLNGKEGLETH